MGLDVKAMAAGAKATAAGAKAAEGRPMATEGKAKAAGAKAAGAKAKKWKCSECIQCGACIDACPKKVLKYRMKWRRG